jgi:hypothetical protein
LHFALKGIEYRANLQGFLILHLFVCPQWRLPEIITASREPLIKSPC